MRPPVAFHRIFLMLAGLAALPLTASVSRATPSAYFQETIDPDSSGCYPDIVMDHRHHLHAISTNHDDLEQLLYHEMTDGKWSTITLDDDFLSGACDAIDVDPAGEVHVIAANELTHAVNEYDRIGDFWAVTTIANDGFDELEFKIDRSGGYHIAYVTPTGNVQYGYRAPGSGTWTFQTVGSCGGGSQDIGLAIDPEGHPRIVYGNLASGGGVFYAERAPTGWVSTTIFGAHPVANTFCSIALDASGSPHVAFSTDQHAHYATNTSGSWIVETLEAEQYSFTDISVDSLGQPHVTYDMQGVGATNLRQAVKTASGWTYETLASEAGISEMIQHWDTDNQHQVVYFVNNEVIGGFYRYLTTAIQMLAPTGGEVWPANSRQTVRGNGAGPVSIELSTDGGLNYQALATDVVGNAYDVSIPAFATVHARIRVTRTSPYASDVSRADFVIAPGLTTPWWSETAVTPNLAGQEPSIAIDADGLEAASYWEQPSAATFFARRRQGNWIAERVDGSSSEGPYSSLAFASDGQPRIAYWQLTSGALRYGRRTSTGWAIEDVDSGGVGKYAKLRLNGQDLARVAYLDVTNGHPKFALQTAGGWILEVIDPTGIAGSHISLALQNDVAQVAYYDNGNGDLKYAIRDPIAGWVPEIVDAAGSVGQYTSIAIASDGTPHISYYDLSNGNLRYATKSALGWRVEQVDTVGDVGQASHLVIHDDGRISILYYDATNHRFKVATRENDHWLRVVIDSGGDVGSQSSALLDPDGALRAAYYDATSGDLKFASTGLEVLAPYGGLVWPAGAGRSVGWRGSGPVDISLSTDGGGSYRTLATAVSGGQYLLTVPNLPSTVCKLKLERQVPRSVAYTDSFFTIQSGVGMVSFSVTAAPAGQVGLLVRWQTEPGPGDLAGYRLERREGSGGSWTLVAQTSSEEVWDSQGDMASVYRVVAIDRLGQETVLAGGGLSGPPLRAWPVPLRGGELTVAFSLLGGEVPEVTIYDVHGRLVRRLVEHQQRGLRGQVSWDGRDVGGHTVHPGIYYLRADARSVSVNQRVVVLP